MEPRHVPFIFSLCLPARTPSLNIVSIDLFLVLNAAVQISRHEQRMLRSRIARRVLAEQHIALTTQYHEAIEHGPIQDANNYIGIINTNLSPYKSIKSLENFLPQVTGITTHINIDSRKKNVGKEIKFAFIEDHLQFIVFELIKNSVLAALKEGRIEKAQNVNVTISETDHLIGIRVSDECESGFFYYQSLHPSLFYTCPHLSSSHVSQTEKSAD